METTTEKQTEKQTESTTTTDKQAEETFNLTKHCATNENHYLTWEEFCQSKDVWNQLRRRPRINDYIDYKNNKLTIREVA